VTNSFGASFVIGLVVRRSAGGALGAFGCTFPGSVSFTTLGTCVVRQSAGGALGAFGCTFPGSVSFTTLGTCW